MTQRPLFAKSLTFKRPRRTVNRYGDVYRVWLLADGSGKVCETHSIMGIALKKQFKAVIINEHGERLISRHRKLRPAQAAVIKATNPKPEKRKKVRR
jgi:hypothetical protein